MIAFFIVICGYMAWLIGMTLWGLVRVLWWIMLKLMGIEDKKDQEKGEPIMGDDAQTWDDLERELRKEFEKSGKRYGGMK